MPDELLAGICGGHAESNKKVVVDFIEALWGLGGVQARERERVGGRVSECESSFLFFFSFFFVFFMGYSGWDFEEF
jgi:hypothetical protein